MSEIHRVVGETRGLKNNEHDRDEPGGEAVRAVRAGLTVRDWEGGGFECRVKGLRPGIWGLGFGVRGLGLIFWGLGSRVWGLEFRAYDLGFRGVSLST